MEAFYTSGNQKPETKIIILECPIDSFNSIQPNALPNNTLLQPSASPPPSLPPSGGIIALSLFSIPSLKSQSASRSLPQTRWLFSRGSHIVPQAAVISSAGLARNSGKVNGYLAAVALSPSIGRFMGLAVIPTNFEFIERNEERGGK
ncbi:hypothetical protein BGZ57DRAFT_950734 [Hyaloscypha finlandica]|nr:hypothetical protein BGZ57DRAFT_950734 [Hyaloscypha finlandica]